MFDGEAFGKQMVEVVRGHVARATAPLVERIEAQNATLKAQAEQIKALTERELVLPEKGDKGDKGEPGASVDPETVKEMVEGAVSAAVALIPAAEKGDAGEKGEKGDKGEPGAKGADGVGLADALIDSEGMLVLTMTDGRTKTLGRVQGKDGANGKDGADGLSLTLDDFDIVRTDPQTIEMSFTRGDTKHTFELMFPVPIYRGVFKADEEYVVGDMVTWAGSAWHCNEATGKKPGEADSGWQLAVKAGRAGKDAK